MKPTLQEQIEKAQAEFEHLYYNDLRGEEEPMQVEIFEKFLRAKLHALAAATLEAVKVPFDNVGAMGETELLTPYRDGFNAAVQEQNRRKEEYLKS